MSTTKPAYSKINRDIKRQKKRNILKAIKTPLIVRKPKGEATDREDLTTKVLVGDVVCRPNAFTYRRGNTEFPTKNFRKYTVAEVDQSNRWFRIDGDTKWHNANKFVLLEKAETEIQKMVNKVLQKAESATGDTDSAKTK